MTDTEYLDLAERALQAIEVGCDRLNDTTDADIDNQRVGAMVTLTFDNGSQVVVNLQKPLQEIWLAAQRGGFHFKWQGGRWQDGKTQAELFALLSEVASEQSGYPLVFSPSVSS
jgi:CyaY protein